MTEENRNGITFSDVTGPDSGGKSQTPDTPDVPNTDEFEFVRINGVVHAVPKSAIKESPVTEKQDGPDKSAEPEKPAEFYVHLANGDVLRVAEADLPDGHAANQPHGHWRKGNSVFQVIGVYPVEIELQ